MHLSIEKRTEPCTLNAKRARHVCKRCGDFFQMSSIFCVLPYEYLQLPEITADLELWLKPFLDCQSIGQ